MAEDHSKNPGKEPFMSQQDRPDVELPRPETPLSQLTVRDLGALLGHDFAKPIIRDIHKPLYKEFKDAKNEKFEKPEFKEFKDAKLEKYEKPEFKEYKDVREPFPDPKPFREPFPDKFREPFPDLSQFEDLINPLITELSGLRTEVARMQERLGKLEGR